MLTTADKIRLLYAKGMRQADIAQKLGISRQRVGQVVHNYGLGSSIAKSRHSQLLRWLNHKPRISYGQIAAKMKVSETCISGFARYARKAGLYSGRYRVQQEAAE